jgi:hypothetical protein
VSAICLLVRSTDVLCSIIALIGNFAVGEDRLADKGWHGLGVVLKPGSGAVGTGAGVVETSLEFGRLA